MPVAIAQFAVATPFGPAEYVFVGIVTSFLGAFSLLEAFRSSSRWRWFAGIRVSAVSHVLLAVALLSVAAISLAGRRMYEPIGTAVHVVTCTSIFLVAVAVVRDLRLQHAKK
jgi:hypothetical protein